jgi:hypothetical protein
LNQYEQAISEYFNWLDVLFGELASEVQSSGVTSGKFAQDYLSNTSKRAHLLEQLPSLASRVATFWDQQTPRLRPTLDALPGVKGMFGGDIGPRADSAIFQRAGLYFNTIVVPDPLHRISSMPDTLKIPEYYFLKYAIDQLLQKDIYLAPVWPPIAFLGPEGLTSLADDTARPLTHLASLDCVILANQLFGENFDTYDQVKSHFTSLATPARVLSALARPDLLYLDSHAPLTPAAQIDALIARNHLDWKPSESDVPPESASFILFHLFGRLLQANALYSGALASFSHPIVDAPASFHWLQWKLISNQDLLATELDFSGPTELALTNALLSEQLEWLSAVSIASLVRLRRDGQMSELRDLIGREFERLSAMELATSSQVINQVDYTLSEAIAQHNAEVRDLDTQFRLDLSISGPSLLLSIAALIQPTIVPLSQDWVRLAPALVGTTSLQQVIRSAVTYIRQRKAATRKPIGVLWAAKKAHKTPTD